MESETTSLSPPKKRIKRTALSKAEKNMILNVYKTAIESNPERLISDIGNEAARITGVSKASVFRVMREYKNSGVLNSPKKTKSRKRILEDVDDFDRNAIRRKVHEFFFRNELPTVDKVLKVVNDDPDLPTFKRTTFYHLLKKLNFTYSRRGRDSNLIDKNEIIVWRRKYLRQIKSFREEGRKIYYTDETWVNAGHTVSKVWKDTSVKSSKQAFLSGLSTGLKSPSGKGKRLIITHIGSDSGFVDGGLDIFESNKNKDYHEDMNSERFEKWFADILPRLEDNCVIVIDNAPYHSRKSEKIPNRSWKKQKIIDWLITKNIDFEDDMLKAELLQLVNRNKNKYDKYAVDEMAKDQNKTVLRLPPYHCELNPIELIWAQIKDYVAKENKTFKMPHVKDLCMQSISRIGAEEWKNCIQHVTDKVEKQMWDLDTAIDKIVDSLTIDLNSNSSTSNSESDF